MTDPWGQQRSGFTVRGVINRKDFGVNFSMVSEAGGVLLSNEVKIECNVEFTQAA
jgi:polyisoprenoid-binding protein YceI